MEVGNIEVNESCSKIVEINGTDLSDVGATYDSAG